MRKISRLTRADIYVHAANIMGPRGEHAIGKDERRYAWRSSRTVIGGSRLPGNMKADDE